MTEHQEFIRGLNALKHQEKGCVVTIGAFDGVHLGHQKIIDSLKQKGNALGLPVWVIVFEPQPSEFFAKGKVPARLTRLREKVLALLNAGVDKVLCLRFNRQLRSLTAEGFIQQVLVNGIGAKHVEVGDDFRFGCDRAGDYVLLVARGKTLGFSVQNTDTLESDGERVSSTRIRRLLSVGDFCSAARLLGRLYSMGGRVIYGSQIGRTMGVPTANVAIGRMTPPVSGVFAVHVDVGDGVDSRVQGVANVGVRPTVQGDRKTVLKPVLEVHLLNFHRDIYGEHIAVTFLHKMRDEIRFETLDALKTQIQQDIKQGNTFFQSDTPLIISNKL